MLADSFRVCRKHSMEVSSDNVEMVCRVMDHGIRPSKQALTERSPEL